MSPHLHHVSEVPHQCNELYAFRLSLTSHMPLTKLMLGCLGCSRCWSACKQSCSFFLPFSRETRNLLVKKNFLVIFFLNAV